MNPTSATLKDYDIHVYWDDRAEYFVAEIQDIYSCAADGKTPGEAVANLGETFAVLKETYLEEGLPFPAPQAVLPISVDKLSELSRVIKISRLAVLSGLSGQTLATKMKRGTEFSPTESRRLAKALRDQGLVLEPSDPWVGPKPRKGKGKSGTKSRS